MGLWWGGVGRTHPAGGRTAPTGGAADAAAVGTTVTVTAGVAKNAPSDPMPTEYVDPGGALQVENSVYPSLESAWFQLESAWFQPLSL